MKDAKEALYCMGQMADKCLTSLSAIHKDYNEFLSLVKQMREAQAEQEIITAKLISIHSDALTNKDIEDLTSVTNRVTDLKSKVDEYLKKMEI